MNDLLDQMKNDSKGMGHNSMGKIGAVANDVGSIVQTGAEVGVGLVQTATETGAGLVQVVADEVNQQTDALQEKEAKEEPKEEKK